MHKAEHIVSAHEGWVERKLGIQLCQRTRILSLDEINAPQLIVRTWRRGIYCYRTFKMYQCFSHIVVSRGKKVIAHFFLQRRIIRVEECGQGGEMQALPYKNTERLSP